MPISTQPSITVSTRRVAYSVPVASVGPFVVPFPMFEGVGDDLSVSIDGEEISRVGNWTMAGTPPGASFPGAVNMWMNCSISFTVAVTGELVISGRRSPRRETARQFREGVGVPARTLNSAFNEIVAQSQEFRRDIDVSGASVETLVNQVAAINGFNRFWLAPAYTPPLVGNAGEPLEDGMSYYDLGLNQTFFRSTGGWLATGAPPDNSVTDAKVSPTANISTQKIRYKASGVFDLVRPLEQYLKDQSLNVLDFAYALDPVGDDTNAMLRVKYEAGLTNKNIYIPRKLNLSAEIFFDTKRDASGKVINNPKLWGHNPHECGFVRMPGFNGHMIRFGFLDTNATTGSSFRPQQPNVQGLGFYGAGSGAETVGNSLHFDDGNATPPNYGYGYGGILTDCFFDGSPEHNIYTGNLRNWSMWRTVTSIYAKKHQCYFSSNGDHEIYDLTAGASSLSPGYAPLNLTNVFSTNLYGLDCHDAVLAAGCRILGSSSYIKFFGPVFNSNDYEGLEIYGGGVLADNPIILFGPMFADNSRATDAGYSNITLSSRARVRIISPIWLPTTISAQNPAGNQPLYHIGMSGVCGDVLLEGQQSGGLNTSRGGVTNRPLDVPGCGQYLVTQLDTTNVTAGTGALAALTPAASKLYSIRENNTIRNKFSILIPVGGNGTAAVDLRIALPKGTSTFTEDGDTGFDGGLHNVSTQINIGSFTNFAKLRQAVSGSPYPGGNGAAINGSFEYEIAASP